MQGAIAARRLSLCWGCDLAQAEAKALRPPEALALATLSTPGDAC